MQYIEVELKHALPDPAALRTALTRLGATAKPPTRQIDAYYNAPHRDFLAPASISEWLRLRNDDDHGASINFKRWHPVEALIKTHADEYETPVQDLDALRHILQALDFQPMITIDKTRETWHLPEIEIALDHVVEAGDFVEFEFKGHVGTVEEATARLQEFVDDLGIPLGERINRGYPHMLLGREH